MLPAQKDIAPSVENALISNTKSKFPSQRVSAFFEAFNAKMDELGLPERKITEVDDTAFYNELSEMNKKALTGAAVNTGSGLVATTFNPLTEIVGVNGGVFLSSGVQFKDNQVGSAVFPAATNLGHYVAAPSGTSTTNEVYGTRGSTYTIPLTSYNAEVLINDNPILTSYIGSPAQLYALFEDYLNREKLVLSDNILTNAITTNANIANLAASTETYAPVGSTILRMITNLAKYASGKTAVYLNHAGFYIWLNERNSLGDGVKYPGGEFIYSSANKIIPSEGLVGYYAGAAVYIVPTDGTTGILSTYTVNGSNVITAQTGGTKTVVIVGIPQRAAIAKAGNINDSITIFNRENSLTNFRDGTTVIGARTVMGAGVLEAGSWQLYAF
jgi:hypothetical protein